MWPSARFRVARVRRSFRRVPALKIAAVQGAHLGGGRATPRLCKKTRELFCNLLGGWPSGQTFRERSAESSRSADSLEISRIWVRASPLSARRRSQSFDRSYVFRSDEGCLLRTSPRKIVSKTRFTGLNSRPVSLSSATSWAIHLFHPCATLSSLSLGYLCRRWLVADQRSQALLT